MLFYLKKGFFLVFAFSFFTLQSFAFDFKNFVPQSFSFQINAAEQEIIERQDIPLPAQAFIVSQAPVGSIASWMEKYQKIVKEAKNLTQHLSPYEQADAVLHFLHKKVLKTYRAKESFITRAFDKGFFNCVSSSFLYNLVLTDLGFETRGVLVPNHVFSQIKIKEEWIDAETTTPFGFDAGKRKAATDQFKKLTGSVFVPSSKRGKNFYTIGNSHYLSLIYSNTGGGYIEAKDYHKSLSCYIKALILHDDIKEGHNNLKAGYTQYTLFLIQQNNFSQAEKAILESLFIYPNFDKSLNNLKALYPHWIQWGIKQKEYSQILGVLEDKKDFFTLEERENFYILYLKSLYFQDKNPPKALQEGLSLYKDTLPQAKNFKEYLLFLFTSYFNSLRKEEKNHEIVTWFKDLETIKDTSFLIFLGYEKIKQNQVAQGFDILWQEYQKNPQENMLKGFIQFCYLEVQENNNLENAQTIALKLASLIEKNSFVSHFFSDYFLLVASFALKNQEIQKGIDAFLAFSSYPALIGKVDEAISKTVYQGTIYPLLKQNNYEQALLEFQKTFDRVSVPHAILVENYKIALLNYGGKCYQEKKYETAYQTYVKLLTLFPKDPLGLKNFKGISHAYLSTLKDENLKKKVQEEIRQLEN